MWEAQKCRVCAEESGQSQEKERCTPGLCKIILNLFLFGSEKELLHFEEMFLTILCTALLFKKPICNPESGKTFCPKWRAFILAVPPRHKIFE